MRIMNLYKQQYIYVLSLLLVMMTGCSEKDNFDQPYLNVSEKELSFSSQIDEKTITVNTNCKEWIATTPKPWIHITQNGNSLSVRVDNNTTGAERNSYILVDGGLAVEKIIVKQSSSDFTLGFANNEIILPQGGGTTTADINKEISQYELLQTEQVDWLQVIKKKHSLKFISKANYGVAERTIKLIASLNGKTSEIMVKQPGVSTFILACNPGNPFSLHKMMDFEIRRGSLFTEYGSPDIGNGIYEESYFFKTTSPLFKDVVYVHDTKYFVPTRIYTRSLTKEGVDAVKSQAFQDFLRVNGYTRDEQDTNHYVNIREHFTMDVDMRESNNSVVLFFHQMHEQNRDYETFQHLDLGPIELLHKADKKINDVAAYEANKHSEEIKKQMTSTNDVAAIVYKTNDPTVVARTYYFYARGGEDPIPQGMEGSVEQYSLSIGQPNLGIWQYGNEWFITREFDKLLTANGFESVGYNGRHHVYARRSDFLTLAILGGEFADVNNGKPVMQISVLYKKNVFDGSKQQRLAKVERLLKR